MAVLTGITRGSGKRKFLFAFWGYFQKNSPKTKTPLSVGEGPGVRSLSVLSFARGGEFARKCHFGIKAGLAKLLPRMRHELEASTSEKSKKIYEYHS